MYFLRDMNMMGSGCKAKCMDLGLLKRVMIKFKVSGFREEKWHDFYTFYVYFIFYFY